MVYHFGHLHFEGGLVGPLSQRRPVKSQVLTKVFPLQLQDEVEKCKATYEALNSQLIEELPTLIEAATSIFLTVISEFVLARKLFVGRITKELLALMDVSTTFLSFLP